MGMGIAGTDTLRQARSHCDRRIPERITMMLQRCYDIVNSGWFGGQSSIRREHTAGTARTTPTGTPPAGSAGPGARTAWRTSSPVRSATARTPPAAGASHPQLRRYDVGDDRRTTAWTNSGQQLPPEDHDDGRLAQAGAGAVSGDLREAGKGDERMAFGRLTIAALAVPRVSSLFPGPSAQARELLRERFETCRPDIPVDNTVTGKDGTRRGFSLKETSQLGRDTAGAFLDLPVSFDNTSVRGAISFDLQRKAGNVYPRIRRTLFELLDAEGRQILFVPDPVEIRIRPPPPDDYHQRSRLLDERDGGCGARRCFSTGRSRPTSGSTWISPGTTRRRSTRSSWTVGSQERHPKFYNMKSRTVVAGSPDGQQRAPDGRRRSRRRPPSPGRSATSSRGPPRSVSASTPTPRSRTSPASSLSQSVLDNFVVLADEWPKTTVGTSKIRSVSRRHVPGPGDLREAGRRATG